jgi:lipopolysaccharide-binding protein
LKVDTNIRINRTNEGKINFFISNLKHSIGNIDIKLSGGASWIYNIFLFIFRENLRRMIDEQITKTIYTVIHDIGNEQLNTIPYIFHFQKSNISIDYTVHSNTNYKENLITIPFKGEFFYTTNRVKPDYEPRKIPDFTFNDKKINIVISDHFFRTAGDIFHKNKELYVWITDEDVPPDSPVRLNTLSFACKESNF